MPQNKQMRNSQTQFKDRIKYLTNDEWKSLKSRIDNYRDKILIQVLYSTGCRVGEVSLIRVEQIDFENRFIHIPPENTKTKQGRTVRVGLEALNDIKAYLKVKKRKNGWLFAGYKGHLGSRRIQQLINKYAVKSGIQDIYGKDITGRKLCRVTPHTLRHTHIVHNLMSGVPANVVQQQAGHKRLTTTQIYSRVAPEQIKEAYDRAGME